MCYDIRSKLVHVIPASLVRDNICGGCRQRMNFAEKKEKILNALFERHGLQHMMDEIGCVLSNPVFLYDLSGKVLAKSQNAGDDEIWSVLIPGGRLKFANMLRVEESGVYQQILNLDAPVEGTFEFSPYRFLGCRVRDKDGAVGIVTVVEKHRLQADDADILIVACKAILFEMLYQKQTAMQTIPYFSLFKDIIEKNIEKTEATERGKVIGLTYPKFMRLIGVGYAKYYNNLSLYFIRESITSFLPSAYCIIYENLLLILLSDTDCTRTTLNTIRDIFTESDIWIGISRRFADIITLPLAYDQIKAIKDVRTKLDIKKGIIDYEEILLYHFFQTAAHSTNIMEFCVPVIGMLDEYDKTNGTQLRQCIECYLESGRSIVRAAEKLHIHKNTLYYRLQRAADLFELDLSDENLCFNLQFSFRLQRMMK